MTTLLSHPAPSLTKTPSLPSKSLALLLPFTFYTLAFLALTWPLCLDFPSKITGNGTDSLQNVWNLWWVNQSITHLQNPYHTTLLFYPQGTSLLAHTLNPLNGLLAIPLLQFFSLPLTYNLILTLSFAATGTTSYYLTQTLIQQTLPTAPPRAKNLGALTAGFAFTFSSFHFAHALGHLQLVSIEFLPLSLLFIHNLLTKPTTKTAIAAAISLFLTLLCDHYQFTFIVLTALALYIYRARELHTLLFPFRNEYKKPILWFIRLSLLLTGPIIAALIYNVVTDPPALYHQSQFWGADPLSPLIPAQSWRFSNLTRFYWSQSHVNEAELPLNLGLTVIALAIIALFTRQKIPQRLTYLAIIFYVLSLGPKLNILGHPTPIPLPYRLLEIILPILRLGGMPSRMMLITLLTTTTLAGIGLTTLLTHAKTPLTRSLPIILLLTLLFESLPAPLPATPATVPPYVTALRNLPGTGAVTDLTGEFFTTEYYQTVHQKPLPYAYVSREFASATQHREAIQKLEQILLDPNASGASKIATAGDLHRAGVDYVIASRDLGLPSRCVVFNDGAIVYSLLRLAAAE